MSKQYYEDNSRISNSTIGYFLISPKYFRNKLDRVVTEDSTSYQDLGTRIHMFLLERTLFSTVYKIVKAYKKPVSAQQTKFCEVYAESTAKNAKLKALEAYKSTYVVNVKDDEKTAKKALELAVSLKTHIKYSKSNDILLEENDMSFLNSVENNIKAHKLANELLLDNNTWLHNSNVFASNEFHINWDIKVDSDDIVNCKSLLDRVIINHDTKTIKLIDLKTTSFSDFKGSFNKYDYARQLAFYWLAITHYFINTFKDKNISEYKQESYIITVNTNDASVNVYKIKEDILLEKTEIIYKILNDINWHLKTNNWEYTREYYEGDGSETLYINNDKYSR